ncbi:MAG: PAS domain S-box protein, partial [Calditrichota bacterium]
SVGWWHSAVLIYSGVGMAGFIHLLHVRILRQGVKARDEAERAVHIRQAQLDKIFNGASDAIVYLNADGEILTVNQKLVDVSGFSREELVGKNFFRHEIVSQSDADKVQEFFQNIRSQNGNLPKEDPVFILKELELARKEGEPVLVEANTTPIRNGGATVEGFLTLLSNNHQHEEAEKKLLLQAAALKAAPIGIMITDVKGKIIWVNAAMVDLTRYERNEMVGETPRIFKSGKHSESFYREMWNTILSSENWQGEMINCRKDGSLYPEEQSITPVWNENGEITHFVSIKQDITERLEAEDALRNSEQNFREIFEQMQEGVFRTTAEGELVLVNSQFASLLNFDSAEHILGTNLFKDGYFSEDSLERIKGELEAKDELQSVEAAMRTRIDKEIQVRLNIHKLQRNDGGIRYYEGTVEDITEHKALEQQLIQAQKMEAIGQLAGGVAHDFNNLLTVIKGYSQLLLAEISFDQDHEYYSNLTQIDSAAKRAESLTRQLLAFSRRQILEPKILDLNDILQNLEKMLRRLIEEDIDLKIQFGSELGSIKADSGQIEQVIINMVVNARDAMPEGGKLLIETSNAQVNELSDETQHGVKSGHYVKLATVYGIIQQSEGSILVDSVPGEGTVFNIYLPLVSEEVTAEINQSHRSQNLEGSETALVVEDESELRKVIVETLQLYGYDVLEAINASNAIEIAKDTSLSIDLLLTDVVMPEINGKELADRVTDLRQEIKVLFMSGYTDDVIAQYDIIKKGVRFLQKPFTPMDLGYKVRSVLDENGD